MAIRLILEGTFNGFGSEGCLTEGEKRLCWSNTGGSRVRNKGECRSAEKADKNGLIDAQTDRFSHERRGGSIKENTKRAISMHLYLHTHIYTHTVPSLCACNGVCKTALLFIRRDS